MEGQESQDHLEHQYGERERGEGGRERGGGHGYGPLLPLAFSHRGILSDFLDYMPVCFGLEIQ